MAKGQDPFEKFRAATLSDSVLSAAINSQVQSTEPQTASVETPLSDSVQKKVSKTANKEQVCFYLDKTLKKRLARLKYEDGISYNDALEEAVKMLLEKYGM